MECAIVRPNATARQVSPTGPTVTTTLCHVAPMVRPALPTVVRADSHFPVDYQQYVDRHPDATYFHRRSWSDAVTQAFGHCARVLVARRVGAIVGVLPLTQVDSVFAGRCLVSMAYATAGGILADDADVTDALLREAKSLACRLDARVLELRTETAVDPSLPIQTDHLAFRRALPERIDDLLPWLPRKARAAVRRAGEVPSLRVSFGAEHLPAVWRLYARSMRRLGSPNYPQRFFEALVQSAPEPALIEVIHLGARPVAGLVCFLHRDTILPYFAGLDERVEVYGLHHRMYFESMRWAVERGLRWYDFGRSRRDNPGAANFKRFCGFEPTPLQYQRYVPPGRTAPSLSPTAPLWTRARRVWRLLPLPIARPLGAWLARSIPG